MAYASRKALASAASRWRASCRSTKSAAIAPSTDCELEMFVHGALCVSYSGQCFSSEAWGGRSANRGQCAQACRLPYELIVDGEVQPLADARYLLSPGDLYALRQIPEIVEIGVSALKIEGRYKDSDYVALTTAAYRQAVDDAGPAALTFDRAAELRPGTGLFARLRPALSHRHESSDRGGRPRPTPSRRAHGQRSEVTGTGVLSNPPKHSAFQPLKPGDGVVFDAADWRSPEEREEGGRIFEIGGEVALRQRRHPSVAHPPRRPGVAYARSGYRQGRSPLHRRRDAAPQAAREPARVSAREASFSHHVASRKSP